MNRLTECVGFQNNIPIYKTNIDMRRMGSADKLKNALGRYEDLEEQGLLLKLPVPLNSTVYEICPHFIADREKCKGCSYFHAGDDLFRDDPCCSYSDHHDDEKNKECMTIVELNATWSMMGIWLNDNAFGKTVFSTREEAEKKLNEL